MGEIGRRAALELTGFDEAQFDNYCTSAREFACLPREPRGRYYFDESALDRWLQEYRARVVNLSVEDYLVCLDFALAQHMRGYVLSDWGSGRQREFGQKISNWVRGLLGERALKRFLEEKYNLTVVLDFDIYDHIVAQDIKQVWMGDQIIEPAFTVGVKTSKPKSAFLTLSEAEIDSPERRCDAHVFCRVGLPDDHLLRITRDEIIRRMEWLKESSPQALHFDDYRGALPEYTAISCEVAGWCTPDALRRVTEIPGQAFERPNYVLESGLLRRTDADWDEFRDHLLSAT